MLSKIRWIALFALLAGLSLPLLGGCGKYDGLERNMQYVSDDLLRSDLELTWRQVTETHAAWTRSGSGHDKGDAVFAAYEDAYARYSVVYNETLERQGKGSMLGIHLRTATDALPPPPPGMAAPAPTPAARPAAPLPDPAGRELNDAGSASPAAPAAPAGAPAAAAATPAPAAQAPAGANRYVIRSGDSLRSIAKRHGISEKALMEANGLTDPDKIAAGRSLIIPGR